MSAGENSFGAQLRLLVFRTWIEGWRFVHRERRELARAAALPVAVSTLLEFALSLRDQRFNDLGTDVGIAAVTGVPLVAVRISVYRRVFDGSPITWRDFFTWSQVHTLFASWKLFESVALALPAQAAYVASLAYFVALYVTARASFILPAAVRGEPPLVSMAWNRSRNNGWRLVLLDLLVTLPMLSLVLFSPAWLGDSVLRFVVIPLLSCLTTVAHAAAHAAAFQAIVERREEPRLFPPPFTGTA